jgi:FixJ family two-component response regulator
LSKMTPRCAERSATSFSRWDCRLLHSVQPPICLQSNLPDVASCLVLDARLPGLSELDFQTELAKANIHIPIIFMTGHGDIPMSVRAMKGGAVDFLTKPFRDQDMLDAVVTAIERDRKQQTADRIVLDLRSFLKP